jgi:DNA-binding response OmpR family regulator
MADTPTVLVIDDDAGFRAYVRAALGSTVRVVEGDDGEAALGLALRERPDVILLDWRMPGQNGITTCRALRAEPSLAGVRIAMITALDDERDRTLARHAGADAFIVKDPDPDALAAQIHRLLPPSEARTA